MKTSVLQGNEVRNEVSGINATDEISASLKPRVDLNRTLRFQTVDLKTHCQRPDGDGLASWRRSCPHRAELLPYCLFSAAHEGKFHIFRRVLEDKSFKRQRLKSERVSHGGLLHLCLRTHEDEFKDIKLGRELLRPQCLFPASVPLCSCSSVVSTFPRSTVRLGHV